MGCHGSVLRLAALGFALRWRAAEPYSPNGHERIGRIAQSLLVGKHRDQIRTMMHREVIDTADWEQEMTRKYPETETLHFHRQQPDWTCGGEGGLGEKGHVRCDGHGAEKGSLFCALAYFFEQFAHDALLESFPKPKEPIGTPASLPALSKLPHDPQRSAQFLRWLVVLVGDLHQPLHWLSENDYGKSIKVRYKEEERTLFQFWETYLPDHLSKLPKTEETDKEYELRSKDWANKLPTELFRDWAKEVAEKLCTEVYAPFIVNKGETRVVEDPIVLTDERFQAWVKLAEQLLQVGGERLAFVLNEIIEHKRHKEADELGRALPFRRVATGTVAKGSGVDAAQLKEFLRQLKVENRRQYRSNAFYNLFLALLVVPSLLAAFSWHERNPVTFLTVRRHLKV